MSVFEGGSVKVELKNGTMMFNACEVERIIFNGSSGYRISNNENKYDDIITQCAYKHNVPPSLIKAIIKVESNFEDRAVSRKGAMGLMQLMPETAKGLGVDTPFHPASNIAGGTRYMAIQLERFFGDLDKALGAYNAGPGEIRTPFTPDLFPETENFIRKVKIYEFKYRSDFKICSFRDKSGKIYSYGRK